MEQPKPPSRDTFDVDHVLSLCKTVYVSDICEFSPVEEVLPGYQWNATAFNNYQVPQKLIDEIDAW